MNDNKHTCVLLKRSNATRLRILKRRLNYPSVDAVIMAFLDLRDKKGWSKLDIEILSKYGELPEVLEGSARNESELRQKLGLDNPNTKKTSESFVETHKVAGDLAVPFTYKADLRDLNGEKKKQGGK